jgi:hypothetical protein
MIISDIDFRSEKVKQFTVSEVPLSRVSTFIEKWHYSKNVNGLRVSYSFGLFHKRELIGAIIYGKLSMANVWRRYGEIENDVIELKRLCCIDKTPKNTESYFIGHTIRWLKKNTNHKCIISYADPYYGHSGTIYKASNFIHSGVTSPSKVIEYNDKIYHDKTIRTYYTNRNGEKILKPYALNIKNALEDGSARYIEKPEKHIYLYYLKNN